MQISDFELASGELLRVLESDEARRMQIVGRLRLPEFLLAVDESLEDAWLHIETFPNVDLNFNDQSVLTALARADRERSLTCVQLESSEVRLSWCELTGNQITAVSARHEEEWLPVIDALVAVFDESYRDELVQASYSIR